MGITIQSSGGLSKEEIEKMVREAKENANKDIEKKELIETKNNAENIIHSAEKTIKERKDEKNDKIIMIKNMISDLREELKKDSLNNIKNKSELLSRKIIELG